ncbi:MAG: M1 family metallopeptidase [Chitinophagales bacterium]|nr:M1 family metallopeptidase [Chitinophagales bacterium]
MKKWYLLLWIFSFSITLFSQAPDNKRKKKNKTTIPTEVSAPTETPLPSYKPSETRYFDLLHTDLTILPDFATSTIIGTATLRLTPYAKPQNTITLDAQGMQIKSVSIVNGSKQFTPKFSYNNYKLNIDLPTAVTVGDTLSVAIAYIAEPYKWEDKGLEVPKERGGYFIDPLDKNPYKNTQFWTQGETEYASAWFPTIDATNERCTQTIQVTVDNKYKTISNGLLIKSETHEDGTRTDYWAQTIPHASYLFFLAVGEYEKFTDKPWNGKEVSYYTFAPYGEYLKETFGNTPEMMTFFSNKLQVPFAWEKFSQVVANDYTAGAMENSSIVIFYEKLMADRKNLKDESYDGIIAHELFHQWFGDLVTCESWANLTLNESFATYGEYLWFQYKYGQEEADRQGKEDLDNYFKEALKVKEPIVNYHYDNFDDIFDNHRYEKGGRVIHMLRNYLGDDIFFKGLNIYLNENRLDCGEIHLLRMAFEKASGEDLNWFFDQWWLSKGHPNVVVSQKYDETTKTIKVSILQTQPNDEPVFRFPVKIDIYTSAGKTTQQKWVEQRSETFSFSVAEAPRLVNVDADKYMLWNKKESLTVAANKVKFYEVGTFMDKYEVLEDLKVRQGDDKSIRQIYVDGFQKNQNWQIRELSLENIQLEKLKDADVLEQLKVIALDVHDVPKVRTIALERYVTTADDWAFVKTILAEDSSYMVQAKALNILARYDKAAAVQSAKSMEQIKSKYIWDELMTLYAYNYNGNQSDYMQKMMWMYRGRGIYKLVGYYFAWLHACNDIPVFKKQLQTLSDIVQYEENMDLKQDIKSNIGRIKIEVDATLAITPEDATLKAKKEALKAFFP